jgi:actin-like ATPase involved in cell morphogenesis
VALYEQNEVSTWLTGLQKVIKQTSDELAGVLQTMIDKLKKYHDNLQSGGSGNHLKDAYQKIMFSMSERDQLRKLQERVKAKTQGINLLASLAIRLVFTHSNMHALSTHS